MGNARLRRQAFFKAHPVCVFCGGGKAATTIEHCPPKSLFQDRQWPEGFEFPACDSCNHGSSDQDLLIALLARMDPLIEPCDRDGRLLGILKNVNAQFPGMAQRMKLSPAEARSFNRELGISPQTGQTHQESGLIRITSEMDVAVRVFSRKLSKAIFYLDTRKVFPNNGYLLLNWFTNSDLLKNGSYWVFDMLKDLSGSAVPLQRSGTYLNQQFEYKLSISNEKEVFALQARFSNSFGFVVFGSSIPGVLKNEVEKIMQQSGNPNPFIVLQST